MSLVPFALDPFFGDEFIQPFRSHRSSPGHELARGVAMDVVEVRVGVC